MNKDFERRMGIYNLFRSYRKANPENSIQTSYSLAKWSYENSLKGIYIFTPYIPKTVSPFTRR